MKVSVSLSENDIDFLDKLTRDGTYASRSAAVAAAVRLLRQRDLTEAYADATKEWVASGEAAAWEGATGDGIAEEERWW